MVMDDDNDQWKRRPHSDDDDDDDDEWSGWNEQVQKCMCLQCIK